MESEFSEFTEIIKDQFDSEYAFDCMDIQSWSSMQSLIVVSALHENYNVLLSHMELKSAENIDELFQIIKKKQA